MPNNDPDSHKSRGSSFEPHSTSSDLSFPAGRKEDFELRLQCKAGIVEAALSNLPSQDRKQIEQFWRVLVINSYFGFTLYGSKALSTADGFFPGQIEQGLAAWQRWAERFPSTRFTLGISEDRASELGPKLFILDRRHAAQILKSYGAYPSTESQAQYIAETLNELQQRGVVGDNREPALYGTLLGFGHHNARCWERMKELTGKYQILERKIVDGAMTERAKRIARDDITPSEGFDSTQGELDHLVNISSAVNQISAEMYLNAVQSGTVLLPQFIAFGNHPESSEIQERFKRQQKRLEILLRSDRFLPTILKRFM